MGHELHLGTRKFHKSARGNKGAHTRMKSREGRVSKKHIERVREEHLELSPKYRAWKRAPLVEEPEKIKRKQ